MTLILFFSEMQHCEIKHSWSSSRGSLSLNLFQLFIRFFFSLLRRWRQSYLDRKGFITFPSFEKNLCGRTNGLLRWPDNSNTSMHSQTLGGALSMKRVKEATDADSCPLMDVIRVKSWLGESVFWMKQLLRRSSTWRAPWRRWILDSSCPIISVSWADGGKSDGATPPTHPHPTKEALISQPPNSVFPQCDFSLIKSAQIFIKSSPSEPLSRTRWLHLILLWCARRCFLITKPRRPGWSLVLHWETVAFPTCCWKESSGCPAGGIFKHQHSPTLANTRQPVR